MNLVDSCGWLEYFADGPQADFYAAALEDPGSLIVPTICLLEVFKRVLQQRGEDVALQGSRGHASGVDRAFGRGPGPESRPDQPRSQAAPR